MPIHSGPDVVSIAVIAGIVVVYVGLPALVLFVLYKLMRHAIHHGVLGALREAGLTVGHETREGEDEAQAGTPVLPGR